MNSPDRFLVAAVAVVGALLVIADVIGAPDVIGSIGGGFLAFVVLRTADARVEDRRRAEQERQAQIRDLNETRRLLYMGYYLQNVDRSDRREVVGTLINALVHHQHRMSQREGLTLGSKLMSAGETERIDAPWTLLINDISEQIEKLEKRSP